MTGRRKKEAAPSSLNGAVTASFKLEQYYFLTQFILQTLIGGFTHQNGFYIRTGIIFLI